LLIIRTNSERMSASSSMISMVAAMCRQRLFLILKRKILLLRPSL
jgi:hypothetical protein